MSNAKVYNRKILNNNCLAFKTITNEFKSFWHSHREFEIVYIESGSGSLQYGKQQQVYQRGDLFLLGPWIPHEFLETSKSHISISLLFNKDFITPGFLDSHLTQGIRKFLEKSRYGLFFSKEVFDVEIDIINLVLAESGLAQALQLLSLLERLSNHDNYHLIVNDVHELTPNKTLAKKEDILSYIHKNACRKLLQEEVAKTFYMSTSHLSRFFTMHVGISFSQYLLAYRIEKACCLLKQQELTITQISQEVGFESLSSFNRHFLKLKGCSPSQYKQHLSN